MKLNRKNLFLASTATITLTLSLTAPSAFAQTNGNWTGGGASGIWGGIGNWESNNIATGANSTATFNNSYGTYANPYNIIVNTDRVIGNINFTGTLYDISIDLQTATRSLTLDVTSGAPTITVATANRTLTITAPIEGSDGLTKAGAGTLRLTGSNTYTGNTTISAGILSLGNSTALQNSALNTLSSVTGNSTAGLRSTVATLTLGGLTGNKSLASVFTTTSGNYTGLTALTLNPGANVTQSYSGAIADGAAGMRLTKSGAGKQVLSGNNTYTGNTTINNSGGTLSITNANALGSGNVTISTAAANTGTLELALTGNNTIANTFNGFASANALTNSGNAQILNTSGNNTISSDLRVTTIGGNGLNVASDGGLLTLAGNITQTAATGGRTLSLGGGGDGVVSGTITNGNATAFVSVIKSGSGTWTLTGNNTYTGSTTINGGTLSVGEANNLGAAAANLVFDGGTLQVTGTTLGNLTSLGRTNPVVFTANKTVGFDIADANNSFTVGQVLNQTAGGLTKLGAGTLILDQTNTYTGNTTISAGTLSVGLADNLGAAAANLVFDGGTLQVTGTALNSLTSLGRTNPVVFTPAKTVGVDIADANNTFTVDQVMNQTTGGFTKSGAGTVILNQANTFTGFTLVSAGKIALGNALALQNSSYNTASINGGLVVTGYPAPTLGGLTGSTNLSETLITGYNSISNLTLNILTGTQTYSGDLGNGNGSMGFTKTGNGTLVLSGTNTYTGTTSINAGSLILTNPSALGTTPGGDGTSAISMAAGTTLRSDENTTVFAPITLSGAGNITFSVGTTTAKTVGLNGGITGTTANVIFSSAATNNSAHVIALGAAGNYTGNTILTGVSAESVLVLRSGVVNALPTTTVLIFDNRTGSGSGRTFQYDLNGNDQELAGLTNTMANSRNQRVNNSGNLATLTINNTADMSFGGSFALANGGNITRAQLNGNISLTKNGTGTFTLGGTLIGNVTAQGNTHTGDTRILGGTLVLSEFNSLQNSDFDTAGSIAGNSTAGLRTSVAALTLGGLSGNKNFADVFTTTSGGYGNLTALTLNPGANVTNSYAADIGDGAGNMSLTKTGAGTQILTGAQSRTGTTSVNAGILTLDYSTANTSKLSDTAALILGGGTLNLSGGTHPETVLGTTLTAGTVSRVTSSGAAPLQMNTITPGAGASVDFGANSIATTDNLNSASGVLGAWATVNGLLAVNSTNTADGLITAVAASSDVTRLNGGLQVIPNGSTNNIRIIEGNGTAANITLGTATTTINTLFQSTFGGTSATTIDSGAQTLRTNAALVAGGAGALTIGNGTLTAATAGGNLELGTLAGTITINSVIDNNTSASSLTKTGSGTLTLTQANSYSGGTSITGGVISLTNATALGSGNVTINGGTRLAIAGGLTVANNLTIGNNTAAGSRGMLESSGTGTATLSGNITINTGAVAGGHFASSTGNDLVLSGSITSSVNVTQRLGTVTYSGGGTGYANLLISGTGKVGANDGIAATAAVDIGPSANGFLDLNGFNQSLVGITKGAQSATIGNGNTTADSILTLTGTSTYAGTIVDVLGSGNKTVALSVASGQLTLSGLNTFSGNVTINGGTLVAAVSAGNNTQNNPTAGTALGLSTPSRTITVGSAGTLDFSAANVFTSNFAQGADFLPTLVLSGTMTNSGTATNSALGNITLANGTLTHTTGAPFGVNSGQGYGSWNLNGTVVSTGNSFITSGNASVPVTLSATTGNTTTFDVQSGTLTVSAALGEVTRTGDAKTSGFIKTGNGTLALTGNSSYTGTTTINQGTLAFNTTSPSLTGGLTFGANTTITPGILDLTSASATFAGALLVNTNSATASEIKIGANQSLTANGSVQIGASTPPANATTTLAVTGAGEFVHNGSTFLVGGQSGSSPRAASTLDLTGISKATITTSGNFRVAPNTITNNGGSGTLLLPTPAVADTVLTANITSNGTYGIGVGIGGANNGSLAVAPSLNQNTMQLGTGLTKLNAATILVGSDTIGGTLRDSGRIIYGQAAGDLIIRAADGTSRATAIHLNYRSGAVGNTGVFFDEILFDVSGHDADILVGTINLGGGFNRIDGGDTRFKFGAGDQVSLASVLDATSVNIGNRSAGNSATTTQNFSVDLSGGTVTFGNAGATGTGVDIGNSAYDQAGAATFNSELNISGGNVTLHNGNASFAVRLGQSTAANSGIVNASMNLTGGTTTLTGDIVRGTANGTVNSTLSLNGANATLDMGGHDIGNGTSAITLTTEAGTLRNVASINGSGGLTKSAAGTLVVSGNNTYTGNTIVNAGTVALGADNALPANPISIGTATLNASTFDDTLGALDAAGNATINLGTGANLIFANSSGVDWTGGTLNITGTFVSGSSLNFGPGGLSGAQLAVISVNGAGTGTYTLNPAGFLVAPGGANYASWAAINAIGSTPTQDKDGDGVSNAVEYVLGGNVTTNDISKLPKVSTSGGNMLLTFERLKASVDGSTTVTIQVGTTLVTWPTSFSVPGPAQTNVPGVTIATSVLNPLFDTVTLSIPQSPDPRKFARLNVIVTP
jgi:autotransporter-associated beta strand protein